MAKKLTVAVSADELLKAGAPKTAVRQYYRKNDVYEEVKDPEDSFNVTYVAEGSARQNHFYVLPAKTAAGEEAESIATIGKVVWGGSIKDSYVLVTEA